MALEIYCFERGTLAVTNYYDSIEISFYSIYFHHGIGWNFGSSGLSQHGAADRDSETSDSAGEGVRSQDQDMAKMGSYFLLNEIHLHLYRVREDDVN